MRIIVSVIVRCDNTLLCLSTYPGCGVHREIQFVLTRILQREPLLQKGSEARPGAASETVKDEESLRPRCIFDFPPNLQVTTC